MLEGFDVRSSCSLERDVKGTCGGVEMGLAELGECGVHCGWGRFISFCKHSIGDNRNRAFSLLSWYATSELMP